MLVKDDDAMPNPPKTTGPLAEDESVEQMRAELATLREFRRSVVKLASHDLRSPLALMTGYASLVSFDVPEDSPVQDYVRSILTATTRMTGLADSILTLDRLLNEPMPQYEQISLVDLAQAVADEKRHDALSHQHEIAVVGSPDATQVLVNGAALSLAIAELLANAVMYSEPGQQIVMAVAPESADDGDRVSLLVHDQGWGIVPEQHDRVWDAYFRGKLPSGNRSEGRGLGLWMVKTIVERHGGGVLLSSMFERGSDIGFWLPAV